MLNILSAKPERLLGPISSRHGNHRCSRRGWVGSVRGTAGALDQGLAGPGQQQHHDGELVPEHVRSVRGTAGGLDLGLAGPAKVITSA